MQTVDAVNAAVIDKTDPRHPDYTEWVHCLDAGKRRVGDLLGWQDARSETGMCSGYIVETDHLAHRVRVRDIRAAVIR